MESEFQLSLSERETSPNKDLTDGQTTPLRNTAINNSSNPKGLLRLWTPAQESVACKFLQGQDKKRAQVRVEAPTIEG